MLLGANGQNVYPEEIEDKLNNLPLVGESIIIQRGNRLVALVHPEQEDKDAMDFDDNDVQGSDGRKPKDAQFTTTTLLQGLSNRDT